MDVDLSSYEFGLFQKFIYEKVGISLSDQKSSLIKSRLAKRLRELELDSFHAYYDYLKNNRGDDEITVFINAISTNVTSFFRESTQWAWFENNLDHLLKKNTTKRIRIWSAGCSTGEEPYTMLMFLQRHLPAFREWDIRILATDISTRALEKASSGIFSNKSVEELPKDIIIQSFEKIDSERGYRILPHLREKVIFRTFNLVTDPFILSKSFDMVFCRNVMIYFDEPTRYQVIEKFARVLDKGSPLFLGSSESLTTQKNQFRLIGSSIYEKI